MFLKPSPNTKPICPYFYQCGGCDSQDISYNEQVLYKESWLKDLFQEFSQVEWRPFLASQDEYPTYFRNKLRFSFIEVEGKVWPSRHRKGEEAAEIAVDRCFLQSPTSNEIINHVASFAEHHQWSLYNPAQSKGWLKHILIRESKSTGNILLSLVTDDAPIVPFEEWIESVTKRFPQIVSLWQSVSWGKDVTKLQDIHLWGTETLLEEVGSYRYHISPQSFFQTNGSMVKTLYDTIANTAQLSGQETVWDLYAGSATIGIHVSAASKQVISIEENPSNIADAQRNLAENKISNLTIVPGTVEGTLSSRFVAEHGPADCIIVDPPRAGLHPSVKQILPHLPPHRLIYVSCNPTTCLRDIRELTRQGYELSSIRGIDMFPHTWHCELVAELRIMKV